ncbi:DUF2867 domain-containing protein [Aquimarina sediminis]|uniref:DUF2867 domain-containing protein n=1 Tax=Aquimarina sediminis TaxID=2070536 RepID=UPI000CA01492|nr:DUF2867 domain-containing protein [Aquimarina sediminis]
MPIKVKEEKAYLTETSRQLFKKIDFIDTFSTTNHTNTMMEISNLVFNTSPKWVGFLFKIRNGIVKLFGLKTSMPKDYNTKFEVGGYIKFFKIYEITENEVVLGANDSHLNFRAIINNTHSPIHNIKVTTLVQFNNSMGRIYMSIIKPFHRLVVIKMVKQAYNN